MTFWAGSYWKHETYTSENEGSGRECGELSSHTDEKRPALD